MTLSKVVASESNWQRRSHLSQNWCEEFDIQSESLPQPNTWVKLYKPLDLFCYDEALLLCQQSEFEWIAWIPDYGEVVLNVNQFY
jgi:hypothetical protein